MCCALCLQKEIQTLKEAQEAARQERRLMMLQQKEISKMRRSTQYYREKIHKYRQRSRASVSPDRSSRAHDTTASPAPSLDERERSGVDEQLSSFSMGGPSDMERDSSVPPPEQLEESFPTYTPVKSADTSSSTLKSPDRSPGSNRSTPVSRTAATSAAAAVSKSPHTLSPLTLTTTTATDSLTVRNLKKRSVRDTER